MKAPVILALVGVVGLFSVWHLAHHQTWPMSPVISRMAKSPVPACEAELEKAAAYQAKWTVNPFMARFSEASASKSLDGQDAVLLRGDKIMMQNGFGAWQNMTYEYSALISSAYVFNIDAKPGRL